MSIVGKKAPIFKAPAVINGNNIVEDFSLEKFIGKKEVILFFYPKDFTFVCPTEILEYQKLLPEFEKRDVVVVGVSTDTEETHLAWLSTPRRSGGIAGVTYPLVADVSKVISSNFGVLGGDWDYNEDGELVFEGSPTALRGTFLIDKEGIVRHEYINFYPLGRNIADSLRIVDAWHHSQEHGEVCPANWEEGQDAMKESRDGVIEYLSSH
jgi:peroxiredoxin (alkyl hydroperoxide reductase subunit C)